MTDISSEPTMEDILSSIKKIIADDSAKTLSQPRPKRAAVREEVQDLGAKVPVEDDILELTEDVMAPEPQAETVSEVAPAALVSTEAETASRSALDQLSAMIVKPEVTGTDTLEGMVREMLRPMLRDWLDANLPRIVESLVSKEIARISGKSLI